MDVEELTELMEDSLQVGPIDGVHQWMREIQKWFALKKEATQKAI